MRLAAHAALLALTLCVLSTALPPCAGAQGGDPDARALEEARGAFAAGQAAYDAGRFEEALTYFERVYELTQEPDVLYNLATVHDRLQHRRDALDAYRAYLEARPDSEARANIEGRVRFLERALSSETEPPPELSEGGPTPVEPSEGDAAEPGAGPMPEPEPTPEPSGGDIGAGPWILIAFGGAALIASGVLFGLMASDFSTVEGASAVPWDGEVREAWERAPQLSVAGAVTVSVAALALLAGAIWIAVGAPHEGEVALGPGGIAWRRAF